jgi:hypothetical protein
VNRFGKFLAENEEAKMGFTVPLSQDSMLLLWPKLQAAITHFVPKAFGRESMLLDQSC